jgi:hypothetical protein
LRQIMPAAASGQPDDARGHHDLVARPRCAEDQCCADTKQSSPSDPPFVARSKFDFVSNSKSAVSSASPVPEGIFKSRNQIRGEIAAERPGTSDLGHAYVQATLHPRQNLPP